MDIEQGNILIAQPFLQDGYFKRSVIYLCEHTSEGSLGFVMNRPQGLLLRDVFPHIKNGNFPVFEGGPVSVNQLYYIHTLGEKLSDSIQITDGVYWGGNFFELAHMIEHGQISSKQIRFFVGYSGWSEEQLNDELSGTTWFIKETDYNDLISVKPSELWGSELIKLNPGYRAFSDFAHDPSLN